jgi:hypothetical protein
LLARIVALRWARIGGFDLVVPAAIAAVIWTAVPQLGSELAGIPFGVAWIVLTAAVVAPLLLWSRARSGAIPTARAGPTRLPALGLILVVGIVVSWVLYDVWFWGHTNQLYDLDVYLGSAGRWLAGGQPYMTAPVTAWPSTPGADFFLYPPPLLPVFAALSKVPEGPVDVAWVAFLIACAYKSYRILGLPRVWGLALLAFPPVAIGFESGNVASLTFLLFAAGARAGGALVVDGLFKTQTGLPALWLIRQRRWRAILAGAAVVAAVVLATLPLVGLHSWQDWWAGLGYRAASQAAVPALYGYSYAKEYPSWAFAAISAALVVAALLFRGRRGLAALGLASIFASPALWPHGFVFALPALLMLENGAAVWLVLGAGSVGPNMWHLFNVAWIAVLAARRLPSGALHPLAGTDGPWPNPLAAQRTRSAASPTVRVGAIGPGSGGVSATNADRSELRPRHPQPLPVTRQRDE